MTTGVEGFEVRESVVDGVPVMWLPVDEGSMIAALVFRVGRSDEQLAYSGVAHLLEHLALFEVGRAHPDLRFNGQVDQTTTMFVVEGSPAQVVTFLDDVCRRLHDLPAPRLEVERDILRSEADGRSLDGPLAALHRWRFGARGYGLVAWKEYGLNRLGMDDVSAWASRFATAGNAAVWMTGEPPKGLRLPLPDGPRVAAPDMVGMLPRFPAWFNDGASPVTAAHCLVERSSAARGLAALLEKRLVQRIRYELGASYSPQVAYEPSHPRSAELMVLAEPVSGQDAAVAHEVLTALSAMAEGNISADSLTAWLEEWERTTVADPAVRRGWLVGRAIATLVGGHEMTAAEYMAEMRAVDVPAVAAVAAEAASTALYRIPPDVTPPPGIVRAPAFSPELGAGRAFEERRASADSAPHVIHASPLGISLTMPDGNHVTITAADAEALLVWPHDLRTVIGANANTLDVNAAYWHHGRDLIDALDAMVPADKHVPMRADIDPPPGPANVGEPLVEWLVATGVLAIFGLIVAAIVNSWVHLSFLPLVLWGLGAARALRWLQQTRRARGLRFAGWPR